MPGTRARVCQLRFRRLYPRATVLLATCVLSMSLITVLISLRSGSFESSSIEARWEEFLPATASAPDYCTERDLSSKSWIREVYGQVFSKMQIACERVIRIGAQGDGGKLICMDHVPTESCVIYSLGSDLDFEFEISAMKVLGCEIHTFDCTVGDVNATVIPVGVTFHAWCIGGAFEKKVISSNYGHTGETGQYYPMSYIMKILGHKKVDLLKMDIERHEFSVIESFSVDRIPSQILFETHLHNAYGIWHRPLNYREWRQFWNKLESFGYRVFSYEPNPFCLCCCEWSIIRVI